MRSGRTGVRERAMNEEIRRDTLRERAVALLALLLLFIFGDEQ